VAVDAAALPDAFFKAREDRKKTVEFLLSHWHCIVPGVAIVLVMFLRERRKNHDDE
jgi:hypothetical protein